MKAFKMDELTALDTVELTRRERELRESLFKMRMRLAIGQFNKVADVNATKKNVARLLTVLNQRQDAK